MIHSFFLILFEIHKQNNTLFAVCEDFLEGIEQLGVSLQQLGSGLSNMNNNNNKKADTQKKSAETEPSEDDMFGDLMDSVKTTVVR